MTRYLHSPIALRTKLRWNQHYWVELDCNLHVSIKAEGVRWLGVRLGGGGKKYCRKRELTEREGSSQLTNDAKVDPYECNYHRRLAVILIKGAENLSLGAFFPRCLWWASQIPSESTAHATIDTNKNRARVPLHAAAAIKTLLLWRTEPSALHVTKTEKCEGQNNGNFWSCQRKTKKNVHSCLIICQRVQFAWLRCIWWYESTWKN